MKEHEFTIDQTVSIDGAGRIVLPIDVRQELAIKPGDFLKIRIHGSSVTLTPNKTATGLVRKGKALVFSTTSSQIIDEIFFSDILENTREERDNDLLPQEPIKKKKIVKRRA